MALGRRHGMSAFEPLAGALDDADPRVRGAAASALGELGEPAVARLVERIREADLDGARDAMVAMARAGPAGRSALAGIASSHPDEAVRSFARFLLGRPGRPH
jgi:HEAT repeat protein